MSLRFAVIVFPGTWSDHDTHYSLAGVLGQEAELVWHQERDLSRYDVVVLPGGFSYGDYLRAGALARFSPVMAAVAAHADAGKPLIGICNGFQVLCEAHLLPGALMRNESLQYRCVWVTLRVENADTPFTVACRPGQLLRMPISHGEGRYVADEETLAELDADLRSTPIVDPLSGEPFVYRRLVADEHRRPFLLYSLGEDGEDQSDRWDDNSPSIQMHYAGTAFEYTDYVLNHTRRPLESDE